MGINLLVSALLLIGLIEIIQFGVDAPLQLSWVQTEVDGLKPPCDFLRRPDQIPSTSDMGSETHLQLTLVKVIDDH